MTKSNFSVSSAAILIAFFSLLSRVVGLLRDRVLISVVGVGTTLDAYTTAGRIPDALLQLLVVGALSASFIPIFTQYFSTNVERAWQYTNRILNIALVVFAGASLAGVVTASYLAPIVAHGFAPVELALTVSFMRVLFLGQFFFAVSMVFGSVLQGAHRFLLYSLAPVVNNFGVIVGALFFFPLLGPMGLVWGSVLGAFCHASIQFIGVYGLGYRYRPLWRFDADVRATISTFLPRVFGLAISQLDDMVLVSVASRLAAGSVTLTQYAYNINFFPVGAIGVSYAIAGFPAFCRDVSNADPNKRRESFTATVRNVLFLSVPATIVFLLLRAQIVRLVLGTHNFSWEHTVTVADTLAWFAVSFFAQNLVYVAARMFFALRNVWMTTVAGVASLVTNAVFAIILSARYGVPGLGMAFSLASIVQCAVLFGFLRARLGPIGGRGFLILSAKLTVAGAVMAFSMQGVKMMSVAFFPLTTFVNVFIQSAVAATFGMIVFLAVALTLKTAEAQAFLASLRAKALRALRKNPPNEQMPNVV